MQHYQHLLRLARNCPHTLYIKSTRKEDARFDMPQPAIKSRQSKAPPFYPPKFPVTPDATPRWRITLSVLDNPLRLWTSHFFEMRYFHTKWLGRRYMQVMAPDLARQILFDDRDCFKKSHFQDRLLKPALGVGILTAEGEDWRRQRKAAAPAFQFTALKELVPVMAKAGSDTGHRLNIHLATNPDKTLDMHQQMVLATYDVIAETLLSGSLVEGGYTRKDIAHDIALFLETVGKVNFLDLADAPSWLPRELATPGIRKGQKAIERLRVFCAAQIRHRLSSGEQRNDLLGLLLQAHDPSGIDGLSDQQLLDNVITFIGAGHETTALALSWTLMILSHHKGLQQQLHQEVTEKIGTGTITADQLDGLALHERVIKESMRLFPPVAAIPRSVTKPVTIDGIDLVPDDHVTIAVYPMLRHKKLWDDPDAFDPDRFLPDAERQRDRYAYLPFGAGPRICIGMKFAMMEAVTILASLTRDFEFTAPANYKPHPVLSVTLRPKGGMPLFVRKKG
jgi:cytochrome P450